MKRGIYRTLDGNAAYVSGPCAKTAFDIDMGERVPITFVSERNFLRKVTKDDLQTIYLLERVNYPTHRAYA